MTFLNNLSQQKKDVYVLKFYTWNKFGISGYYWLNM